ncbi:MAG: putative bifunctional diguanylate cyclase/phosphodiesterase [Rhodocyclaceae bacterium]
MNSPAHPATSGDLYRSLFQAANDIMLLAGQDSRIVDINEQAVKTYGWSRAELIGRPLAELRSPQGRCHLPEDMAQLRAAGALTFETERQTATGRAFPVEVSARLIDDRDATYLLKIVRDISERKAYEARIHELAYFDPVTGLANRDLFTDRLTQAIRLARRDGMPLTVMLMGLTGLDRMVGFADDAGRNALLREAADRLLRCVRDEDSAAGIGDGRFAILLHADARGAERVAAQILARCADPFALGEQRTSIECDLGIACHPADGLSAADLLHAAEVTLQPAQATKGSEFRFHTPELGRAARRRIELETSLRTALARWELTLHYQPQVDAVSGRVSAVEALMRWHHPDWGWVAPSEFIPVAEDCGLIAALGDWALESAIAQAAAWHAQGLDLRVAVNLSAIQLRDAALPGRIQDVLAHHRVPADRLEIEITESMAVGNVAQGAARLREFTDAGIHLAIDDFGTGYSSLASMKRFRVGLLKIDASFVAGLPDDAEDAAITAAVIDMARALGARTLAEGVETAAQFAWLRAHSCDLAQGWHFARAMPANDIATFCRTHFSTLP